MAAPALGLPTMSDLEVQFFAYRLDDSQQRRSLGDVHDSHLYSAEAAQVGEKRSLVYQAGQARLNRLLECERIEAERLRERALRKAREAAEEQRRREAEAEQTRLRQLEEQRRQVEAQLRAKREAEEKAKKAAEEAAEEQRRIEAEAREQKRREDERSRAIEAERRRSADQERLRRDHQSGVLQAHILEDATNPLSDPRFQSSAEARQDEHRRFLQLHKAFKQCRAMCKNDPRFKSQLGEWRREIRIRVGQISTDRINNQSTIIKLRDLLRRMKQAGGPLVDIRHYILSTPLPTCNDSDAQYPVFLLFALNIFIKCILNQIIVEQKNSKVTHCIGVICASMASDNEWKWSVGGGSNNVVLGMPSREILLAKLHHACPVLFGIGAPDATNEGKKTLGWQCFDDTFVPTQEHSNRMMGFGAAFASMTLLTFNNTDKVTAFPAQWYWHGLARVANTPVPDLTNTHLYVLRGLVYDSADRFIRIFDAPAKAALYKVAVKIPERIKDISTLAEGRSLLEPAKAFWHLEMKLELE